MIDFICYKTKPKKKDETKAGMRKRIKELENEVRSLRAHILVLKGEV